MDSEVLFKTQGMMVKLTSTRNPCHWQRACNRVQLGLGVHWHREYQYISEADRWQWHTTSILVLLLLVPSSNRANSAVRVTRRAGDSAPGARGTVSLGSSFPFEYLRLCV